MDQAIRQAQIEIKRGRRWVVDLDLEAFFDRVNHDRLMKTLNSQIEDKALLRLINRYLKSPIMDKGHKHATTEGVPQGGPLTPRTQKVTLVFIHV